MAKNTSVMGIYPDRTTVSDAISVLQKAGYRPADIAVLASDHSGSRDFGLEKRSKALEGAATGAAVAAAIGAVSAWLISAQAVTVSVPGSPVAALVASLIGAGPWLAAMAGAGAGGALGWIVGLLAGVRLAEFVATRYEGRIRRGSILLSVHCDGPEWRHRASKALKDTGALHVSTIPESSADFGTADKPTERAPLVVVERAPLMVVEKAPLTVAERAPLMVVGPVELPVLETVERRSGKQEIEYRSLGPPFTDTFRPSQR